MMHPRPAKLRVGMVSASFLPQIGGLQFAIKHLCEALAQKGVEVFLLSYAPGQEYLSPQANGFPRFVKLEKPNPLRGFWKCYQQIKAINPDVIHVQSAEYNAAQIAFCKSLSLLRQPFIVTSHGIDIMIEKEIGYGLRLNYLKGMMVKFILKQCDRHVIVGQSMRPFALAAGSPAEKIVEINNGIPLTPTQTSPATDKKILTNLGIPPGRPILLSLSGLRPLKGISDLIHALPRVIHQFPQTQLILACQSDSYEQEIRKLVQHLKLEKNVCFIGFVRDLPTKIALLRACDIFCKPSLLEACSVAILEALREGKTIVATVPAGEDIIQNGINGLLVPRKDPRAFARAIVTVLQNQGLRQKIEEGARQRVQDFAIEKIAQKYLLLYQELLR